jgi:hypothetical protein
MECFKNENDEGERQLEKSLLYEEIRFQKFKEILAFLEEYNYVNADHIRLFNMKRKSE